MSESSYTSSRPFSIDGVVDPPRDVDTSIVEPRSLEAQFEGYEVVAHACVALSPVLLTERAPSDAEGNG